MILYLWPGRGKSPPRGNRKSESQFCFSTNQLVTLASPPEPVYPPHKVLRKIHQDNGYPNALNSNTLFIYYLFNPCFVVGTVLDDMVDTCNI